MSSSCSGVPFQVMEFKRKKSISTQVAKTYNSFSFLNVQSIQSLNFPSVLFSNCKHTPPPPPSMVPGHRRQSACLLGLPWPPGNGHVSFLMIGNPALGSNESFQSGVLMVPLLGVKNLIVAQVVMSPSLILTSSFFWLTGSCQHSCVPRPGYEELLWYHLILWWEMSLGMWT